MQFSEATIAPGILIQRLSHSEQGLLLEVYKQCEDFLALSPTPTASVEMVLADLRHSAADNGHYCGVYNGHELIGVIDWAGSKKQMTAFINLLMLVPNHRGKGIGSTILAWLEDWLLTNGSATTLETAVQINNESAIRFWKRHGYKRTAGPVHNEDGTTVYILRKMVGQQPGRR